MLHSLNWQTFMLRMSATASSSMHPSFIHSRNIPFVSLSFNTVNHWHQLWSSWHFPANQSSILALILASAISSSSSWLPLVRLWHEERTEAAAEGEAKGSGVTRRIWCLVLIHIAVASSIIIYPEFFELYTFKSASSCKKLICLTFKYLEVVLEAVCRYSVELIKTCSCAPDMLSSTPPPHLVQDIEDKASRVDQCSERDVGTTLLGKSSSVQSGLNKTLFSYQMNSGQKTPWHPCRWPVFPAPPWSWSSGGRGIPVPREESPAVDRMNKSPSEKTWTLRTFIVCVTRCTCSYNARFCLNWSVLRLGLMLTSMRNTLRLSSTTKSSLISSKKLWGLSKVLRAAAKCLSVPLTRKSFTWCSNCFDIMENYWGLIWVTLLVKE